MNQPGASIKTLFWILKPVHIWRPLTLAAKYIHNKSNLITLFLDHLQIDY